MAPSLLSCQCVTLSSRLPVTGTIGTMWVRITWMTRGFKIFFAFAFAFDTFVYQQFPFLPVLAFTLIYLSYLSIIAFCSGNNRKHPCLLFGSLPSRPALLLSLSDSSIQLPRKYNIISYTHSITITLIHHSSSSQFLFFLHTPRRIQDSKILCIYIHTLHYASPCCGFAVDTFPPFFLFPSHPFVLLHSRVFMDH